MRRFHPHKNTQTLNVWYIHLHLVDFYGFHVGKYIIHWVSRIVFLSGSFVFSMFLWFCFLDGWISEKKTSPSWCQLMILSKGVFGQPRSPLWHVDGGLETIRCQQASKSKNHNSKTQMLRVWNIYLHLVQNSHIPTPQEELNKKTVQTHRIHVWYIYLHLVDFYGKCRYIIYHTWILWERITFE